MTFIGNLDDMIAWINRVIELVEDTPRSDAESVKVIHSDRSDVVVVQIPLSLSERLALSEAWEREGWKDKLKATD